MTCEVRLCRVLGLPAVLGERMVGHVERAVLDETGHRLRGLVIRRGLGGAKWASEGDIGVLGDVSVILDRMPGRPPKDAEQGFGTVKDESGLTLGRVTDAWISPETRTVTALEVTLGLVEDLREGRRRIENWAVQAGQVMIPRDEWEVME